MQVRLCFSSVNAVTVMFTSLAMLLLLVDLTSPVFAAGRASPQDVAAEAGSNSETTALQTKVAANSKLKAATAEEAAWDAQQAQTYTAALKEEGQDLTELVKTARDRLQAHQQDALANAWLATAQSVRAGKAFQKGNFQQGMKLWSEAIQALKDADEKAPDHSIVQLRVAATALEAWPHDPDETTKRKLGGMGLKAVTQMCQQNPTCWKDASEQLRGRLLKKAKAFVDAYGPKEQLKILDGALKALSLDESTIGSPNVEQSSQVRFDELVREDFFAGMFDGEQERFDTAFQFCKKTLAEQPDHVEAKVWIGCGKVWQASKKYEAGNAEAGKKLFDDGIVFMNEAVAAAPNHLGVLIPRGATLLGLGRQAEIDAAWRFSLLHLGVYDYERTYEIQKPYFDRLSQHARHELLLGLADGWHQLGNQQQVKRYADLILADGDTESSDVAKAYAANKLTPELVKGRQCSGCH